MNRDELLDKLAMELEEWPTKPASEGSPVKVPVEKYVVEFPGVGGMAFTPEEYVQRRAELINRPSWDDAPEWARWLAQDESGAWHWFECVPIAYDRQWDDSGKVNPAGDGKPPAGHNWRDTLEQRPRAQIDIKKCKHCDLTFQRPHLDSIPDDCCTRCHEGVIAMGWDEGEERIDRIAQSDASGDHYEQKSWWTHKPCTLCERQTAAKVSDDMPVCPDCTVKYRSCEDELTVEHDPLEAAMQDQMKWAAEKWARGDMEARSKYHREVKPGVWIDVYDVLQAWDVKNAALQHLIKKALAPGKRGHKDLMTDMDDIVASAKRAKELEQ